MANNLATDVLLIKRQELLDEKSKMNEIFDAQIQQKALHLRCFLFTIDFSSDFKAFLDGIYFLGGNTLANVVINHSCPASASITALFISLLYLLFINFDF